MNFILFIENNPKFNLRKQDKIKVQFLKLGNNTLGFIHFQHHIIIAFILNVLEAQYSCNFQINMTLGKINKRKILGLYSPSGDADLKQDLTN